MSLYRSSCNEATQKAVSIPNEFSGYCLETRIGTPCGEVNPNGGKKTQLALLLWCSFGALLVLLFVGTLTVRISSPLLYHGACVYILCSVVAK